MGECSQRYSTEISREDFYKYRPYKPLSESSVFYGSDLDYSHKTIAGIRAGAIIGAGVGGVMFSFDKEGFVLSRAFERFFRHGLPWVAAGAAYGFTVSAVANFRKKDDALNHILGGLSAGTIIGSSYKNLRLGAWTAVALAAAAGMIKTCADNDYLPKTPIRRPRVFNMYRAGWFTDRPDPEGIQDGDKDDTFRKYRP